MRKLFAILLMLCLMVCLPAWAEEEDDPLKADGKAKVEAGIAEMAQSQTGWKKTMMENTTVVSVKKGKEYVTVTVAIPTMKCGAGAKEQPDNDVTGYLERAVAPISTLEDTTDYAIRITIKGKGDNASLSWNAEKNLSGYKKKVGGMAATAAKSYAGAQMKTAVYRYLLPKAADMPKNKPSAVPEMEDISWYCLAVAAELGLTEAQANARLPYMLMLMQLSKFGAEESLNDAVLTVKIRDWKAMLSDADALAREVLPGMMGVPEMTREEIEAVFVSQLAQVWVDAYYRTKNTETVEIRVDLPAAIENGVQEASGILSYLAAYSAQADVCIDSLMAYGATLDYYPQVALIDTAILSGDDMETGTRVYFDTGAENHGYVCIRQNGASLLKGFVHSGARLMVTLTPGEYEVYCAYGPTWFGENYAFGKECFCGKFTLVVPETTGNVRITLEDNGGSTAVEQITYDDFTEGIGQ